jgi:ELWxxDGT repeat protein
MTIAVYAAQDLNGRLNPFVTDGTASGTSELTVAGASNFGLVFGNPDFTVLGGMILLDGFDGSDHYNLWVTDLASGKTSELSVSGAYSLGLFPTDGLYPDFTVLGSKALFAGSDASGHIGLWVTDGTAAGTSELAVGGASQTGPLSGFFPPISPSLAARSCFWAQTQTGMRAFG